ncbi:MAG: hypothetical protein J0I81_05610, partial [Hyphomicrobium sp.]|nr:hypothetical protein [Hyphomicrobium sp.]
PDAKGKPTLPHWLELHSYIRTIATAPIPMLERLLCGMAMVQWVVRYCPNMAKDLAMAAASVASPTRPRQGLYNWE